MIKILDRFKLFSTTPGQICLIPCSTYFVEAYPTFISIFNDHEKIELELLLTGPVEGFNLLQDLENNRVFVSGRAKEGYFSFQIEHREKTIFITLKRGESISYIFKGEKGVLEKHQFLEIKTHLSFLQDHVERLSLGVNKKLDWDKVLKRGDIKEIFPLLFFLGQKQKPEESNFDFHLFEEKVIPYLFSGMLIPKKEIDRRLGIQNQKNVTHVTITDLLHRYYEVIRAYFFKEENGKLYILPNLPKKFVSGRMAGLKCSCGFIDIQWSKNRVLKVRIVPTLSMHLSIVWPKEIDSFRVRYRLFEKGEIVSYKNDLFVEKGKITYLDKFQK